MRCSTSQRALSIQPAGDPRSFFRRKTAAAFAQVNQRNDWFFVTFLTQESNVPLSTAALFPLDNPAQNRYNFML